MALAGLDPPGRRAPALQAGPPGSLAETGTIKGKLIWGRRAPSRRSPGRGREGRSQRQRSRSARARRSSKNSEITVDPATKGVANGFAFLLTPTGGYPAADKPIVEAAEKALLAKTPAVEVDQVNCEYVPYSTVVHKDQKLIFKSSDPVGHNVDFKPFKKNAPINPMLPPNGKVAYPIKKAERLPAKVICSIHPWMKGWVFIVDNPFAVVTKTDGSFEIKDVPPGEQHLIVWQSVKGFVTPNLNKGLTVTVKAGETTDVGDVKISK